MKISEIIKTIIATIAANTTLKNVQITGIIKSLKNYNYGSYMTLSDGDDTNDNIDCFINRMYIDNEIDMGYEIECVGNIRFSPKYRKIEYDIKEYSVSRTKTKIKYDIVLEQLNDNGILAIPKKPIQTKYNKIGIISSLNAAGLKDCLSILLQNMNGGEIIIYEANVQGNKTADDICHSIDVANKEKKCNVIMIIRGGGAKTDLEDFNDYNLAVKIKNSVIPIVCGIGHEIDNTIVDDIADKSFITPTNAAESITSGIFDNLNIIDALIYQYNEILQKILHKYDMSSASLNDFHSHIKNIYDMTLEQNIERYNNNIKIILDNWNNYSYVIERLPKLICEQYENKLISLNEIVNMNLQLNKNKFYNHNEKLKQIVQPKITIDGKSVISKSDFDTNNGNLVTIKFFDGSISFPIVK